MMKGPNVIDGNYFKDKTLNCFGDSTTWGDNSLGTGGNQISWVSHVQSLVPFKQIRNYGIKGSRIAVSADRSDSFIERYEAMDSAADDVVVFGGVNDFQHDIPLGDPVSRNVRTFRGALNTLIGGLLAKYPTQNLVFITPTQNNFVHPTKHYPNTHQRNAEGLWQKDYVQAMLDACESYCIPVIDLYRQSGICPYVEGHKRFMPDGLHYSEEGYERLSRRIIGLLLPYLL